VDSPARLVAPSLLEYFGCYWHCRVDRIRNNAHHGRWTVPTINLIGYSRDDNLLCTSLDKISHNGGIGVEQIVTRHSYTVTHLVSTQAV